MKRTALDNGTSWIAKLANARQVPRRWLLPRAVVQSREKALLRNNSTFKKTAECYTSILSTSSARSPSLHTEEELKNLCSSNSEEEADIIEEASLTGDEQAWVSVGEILNVPNPMSISTFSSLLLSTTAFTPRDIIFLYFARPFTNSPQYISPLSLKFDYSLLQNEELWKKVKEIWSINPLSGNLDKSTIDVYFNSWRETIQTYVNKENISVKNMIQLQNQLLQITPISYDEFNDEEANVSVSFTIKESDNDIITIAEGLDLFIRARPSRNVPFIKWIPPLDSTMENTENVDQDEIRRSTPAPRGVNPEVMQARPVRIYAPLSEADVATFNAAIQLDRINEIETQFSGKNGALIMAVYAYSSNDTIYNEVSQYTIKSRYVIVVLAPQIRDEENALSGTMTFRSQSAYTNDIIERVKESLIFTNIEILPTNQHLSRISGVVDIETVMPDVRSSAMLITLNPLFSQYFYLEESTYLQSDKFRFSIHFRGQGDDSALITFTKDDVENSFSSNARSSLVATFISLDEHKTRIRISRARTMATIRLFLQVISRALPVLHSMSKKTLDTISSFFGPTLAPQALTLPLSATSCYGLANNLLNKDEKEVKVRNQELGVAAPDVFVRGYARKCQKNKPRIVDENEANELREKGFQVMLYPPPNAPVQPVNGPMLLSCDEYPEAPHPGVSPSELSNSEQFPYYPCCFKSNQMASSAKTHYNAWYGVREREMRKQQGHMIVTDKALDYGRVGSISPFFQTLLQEKEKKITYIRVGVEEDEINSLIHAILTAVKDKAYLDLKTPRDRILRAAAVREMWTKQISSNICAQETAGAKYDIYDKTRPFDAALFYRLIEEALNINIFIISDAGTRLQLPRCIRMHVRPDRLDRVTILLVQASVSTITRSIVASVAASAVGTRYPRYEIVVGSKDNQPDWNIGALMSPIITARLFRLLRVSYPSRTWLRVPGNVEYLTPGYESPESMVDIRVALSPLPPPISQIIDGEGRIRAVLLSENQGLIAFWPSQTLDLPIFTGKFPKPLSLENVLKRHGPANAYDVNQNKVVGVWYTLSKVPLSFYVPCLPEENKNLKVPIGPPSPLPILTKAEEGEVYATSWNGDPEIWSQEQIAAGARSISVASQWVLWLWCATRPKTGGLNAALDSVTKFWKNLKHQIFPIIGHESNFYTPPPLRIFPSNKRRDFDLNWAIGVCVRAFPTLFFYENNALHIRVPSANFSIRFHEYLIRIVKTHGPAAIAAQRFIHGAIPFEMWSTAQVYDELVFPNDTLFRHWFAENHRRFIAIEVSGIGTLLPLPEAVPAVQIVKDKMIIFSTTPIVMLFEATPSTLSGKSALIQNVVGGELKRALAACAIWHSQATNPGFRVDAMDIPPGVSLPAFVILEIQPDGKLEIIDQINVNKNNNELFWIVRMKQRGSFWYASLLPLP